MLSKNFISLLESMKSPYNEMDEDKDARVEAREERRRERREDKFGVSTSTTDGTTTEVEGDSDFKIRPFMRAVEQLKSQVQSEIFNIDQTINNRGSGSQSASTYKTKFNTIMEIISKIVSKMDLMKDKEGRNLEAKDIADIKIFRGLYSTASNDFLSVQKEWSEKKLEAETKYLSDLKDTDTNSLLASANKVFDEATAMLNELIRLSQSVVGDKGATGAADLATGDVIKAGKKYANDSKEGKIVIEVKKTIYKKFKSKLGSKKDWGVVYKSGADNVSGSLLGNTQALIVMIKGGLFKTGKYPQFESDKSGDITPAFIAAINSLTESQSNSFGKLITFENFIKRHVNEDFEFDMEGADQALKDFRKSNGSSSNDTPKFKIEEYPSTPFGNSDEGNKFRKWVNEKYPDWAEQNNLSEKGPENNLFIRKAWKAYGSGYDSKALDSRELSIKEMESLFTEFKKYNPKSTIDSDKDKRYYVESTISKGSSGYIRAAIFRAGNADYKYYNTGQFTPFKTYTGTYDKSSKVIKFSSGSQTGLSDFVECKMNFSEAKKMNQAREISKVAEWLGKDLKWDSKGKKWWLEGYVNVSIDWSNDISKLWIYFDDKGNYSTGTGHGKIATAIKGTWDNGGKTMTFGNKTFKGDNLKSNLVKVFKAAGGKMTNTDGVTAA